MSNDVNPEVADRNFLRICVFISIKVSANLALMFYIIGLSMSFMCEVFVVCSTPKFKALHI